jgi:polyisoprenoid-binding protein YceI
VEDIQANTSSGASVYNASTGDLIFNIPIKSLHFPKQRMQEHFNENYMESDKYPNASFRGKIQEHVDVTKDGSYSVTATGELDVHGVKQKRSIPGTISVQNGVVSMKSEFMVKCVDHHIEIPKIVFYNIAESIKVTASATYQPSK